MRCELIGRAAFGVALLLVVAACSAADLSTGDQCILSADGTDVFLCIDAATHSRLTKLCAAKDETGVLQLVAQGKVTVVKAGARAKIISRGFFTSEVRILEGDQAGESGIVDSEFLRVSASAATTDPKAGGQGVKSRTGRQQVRVTAIGGKTPEEVKGVLGKPNEITPITNYQNDMPGEYRDYIVGRLRVTVQFFRGIAIGASIDIDDPPANTPDDALAIVGLSRFLLTQTFETPKDSPIKLRVVRWRGTVDGVEIEDVSATKTGLAEWALVAVRFPRSLATASRASGKGETEMARYTVHFSSGSQKHVSSYSEDGDSYVITFATGSKGRYPKKMIARFDAIGAPSPAGAARTWTDSTGKHKLDAELVAVEGGRVKLKKADGHTTTIPLEKLSEADRQFVAQSATP